MRARYARTQVYISLSVNVKHATNNNPWSERALRAHSDRAVRALRGRRQVTCDLQNAIDWVSHDDRKQLKYVYEFETTIYKLLTANYIVRALHKKQKRTNRRGRTTKRCSTSLWNKIEVVLYRHKSACTSVREWPQRTRFFLSFIFGFIYCFLFYLIWLSLYFVIVPDEGSV
jgi:hypothetical protein